MTLAAAFAAGNGTKKATVSGTGAPDGIHVHFGRDPNKRVTVTTNASPTSVSTTGSGGKKGKKKGGKKGGKKRGGGRKSRGSDSESHDSDSDSDHDSDSRRGGGGGYRGGGGGGYRGGGGGGHRDYSGRDDYFGGHVGGHRGGGGGGYRDYSGRDDHCRGDGGYIDGRSHSASLSGRRDKFSEVTRRSHCGSYSRGGSRTYGHGCSGRDSERHSSDLYEAEKLRKERRGHHHSDTVVYATVVDDGDRHSGGGGGHFDGPRHFGSDGHSGGRKKVSPAASCMWSTSPGTVVDTSAWTFAEWVMNYPIHAGETETDYLARISSLGFTPKSTGHSHGDGGRHSGGGSRCSWDDRRSEGDVYRKSSKKASKMSSMRSPVPKETVEATEELMNRVRRLEIEKAMMEDDSRALSRFGVPFKR